jgi:ferredoxin
MKRICVDLDRCEGHGRCYAIAPELMGPMDDHGHAEFLVAGIDEQDTTALARGERAVQSCPEEALSWGETT